MTIGPFFLVEFKRPERDNYKRADNPHQQLEDYFEELRTGKAVGKNGKQLKLRDSTPFFAYIICDLTDSLVEILDRNNYKQLPDGEGYIFYHEYYKAYIQVLSYRRLLRDAKRRNQIFFEKLGIDG